MKTGQRHRKHGTTVRVKRRNSAKVLRKKSAATKRRGCVSENSDPIIDAIGINKLPKFMYPFYYGCEIMNIDIHLCIIILQLDASDGVAKKWPRPLQKFCRVLPRN